MMMGRLDDDEKFCGQMLGTDCKLSYSTTTSLGLLETATCWRTRELDLDGKASKGARVVSLKGEFCGGCGAWLWIDKAGRCRAQRTARVYETEVFGALVRWWGYFKRGDAYALGEMGRAMGQLQAMAGFAGGNGLDIFCRYWLDRFGLTSDYTADYDRDAVEAAWARLCDELDIEGNLGIALDCPHPVPPHEELVHELMHICAEHREGDPDAT